MSVISTYGYIFNAWVQPLTVAYLILQLGQSKMFNPVNHVHAQYTCKANTLLFTRLLPNRSPVAWGSQTIALGALSFHSNTFHFICWAPKFSAFSSEGPFKIFLGSSLDLVQ